MTYETINQAAQAGSLLTDLDGSVLIVQDFLGVKSGDWASMCVEHRFDRLMQYADSEIRLAEDLKVQSQADDGEGFCYVRGKD